MSKRLTSKQRKRRSEITTELSRLSRNGWANAKPADYQPLERELDGLSIEDRIHLEVTGHLPEDF